MTQLGALHRTEHFLSALFSCGIFAEPTSLLERTRSHLRGVRAMTDTVRHFLDASRARISRRNFLMASASVAGGMALGPAIGLRRASAAALKEVRFSEAVHNLGYINLYVGMHAKIFEKNGLDMKVSAAGGDTQTFAAVLGRSADFAIGDATMAQISRENGGPGVVVGTVVQRAHYFGVSKTLKPIADPKDFKGLKIVTSPEPNTNYSVAKRMLEKAGLKVGVDAMIIPVNPGTEIAAMLAGQADIAIAYQPSVAAAEAQGAKVGFDFSSYIGPFCNTGITQDLRRSGVCQASGAQGISGFAGRRRR